MIAIIDYGIGNLGSVVKAFDYLDIETTLTADIEIIRKSRGLILPGVGAFGEGIKNLNNLGLTGELCRQVEKGKPLLGICLGVQLLFTGSEENKGCRGLDIIKGKVRKFPREKIRKIPHMGWNQIEIKNEDPLFKGVCGPRNFYFVHSYFVDPKHKEVELGETRYEGFNFTSVVRKGNVWGIQPHPEKSSKAGLKILDNFGEVVKNADNTGY